MAVLAAAAGIACSCVAGHGGSVSGALVAMPGIEGGRNCRSTLPPDAKIRWTIPVKGGAHPSGAPAIEDRWCASVGPALVVPAVPWSVPGERDAAVETVAVVSWNTHVGAGDLKRLSAHVAGGNATNGRRPDAVVFLLQEVLRRSPLLPPPARGLPVPKAISPDQRPAGEIEQWARELGLHLVYVPAMRNGAGREDRGNAILATRPLLDVQAIELPFARQRRTAVAASIDLRDRGGRRQLRVVTAHFDTGLALTRGGPARLRLRSARTLASALEDVSGPVLLGGDLNTSWGDDEPAVRFLRELLPDGVRRDRGSTWHGPSASRGRLDHLFARTGGRPLAIARLSDRFGSDHYPLVAWFDVAAPD